MVVLDVEDAHFAQLHHGALGCEERDVGQSLIATERDAAMVLQVVEQQLLLLGEVYHHVLGRGRALAPHHLGVGGGGEHVLVGHAVVGAPLAVVVGRLHGFLTRLVDVDLEHVLASDTKHLKSHLLLGLAVHLRRLLNHVDLLVAAHPHDVAVVLHPHEQVAPAMVGKGADGAGYLARVSNLILKVLMLVLALLNKALDISFPLRYHYKCKDNEKFSVFSHQFSVILGEKGEWRGKREEGRGKRREASPPRPVLRRTSGVQYCAARARPVQYCAAQAAFSIAQEEPPRPVLRRTSGVQ